MVENIDRWTGRFIAELERRGELDNTIIAFASDHGEMLGDHNWWRKRVPYQESVGVPLVVCGPGVREGVVSDAQVSIVDLAATFLDYGDVAIPGAMDSRSLRPLLEGRTDKHRDVALSALAPWRMAWDGQYKLVRGFDPSITSYYTNGQEPPYEDMRRFVLLYDRREDPQENVNLAERAPEIVERLTAAIET
jgi:arylsulfatase A-like enzyme